MKRTTALLILILFCVPLFSMKSPNGTAGKKFIDIDEKKSKIFKAPDEKLVKWIFRQDSEQKTKLYGSILIKSKGTEGVAFYWIRVWDGKKYYYDRVRRSTIKSGTTVFSMSAKNGLKYTVKCPKRSYTQKTLDVEITGKVLHPDLIH